MGSPRSLLPAGVAVVGEVVDASGLGARAAELAARQRSPQTRRTYAAVYRSLLAFLGEHATVEDLTPEAARAYRDALECADRTPATIAKHLSAIRGLAAAVGADADVRTVRSASVARGEPRALSHEEFARLLKMPDRRTRQGKRDLALLHLLGSAGLRRSEAAALVLADIDERRRAADPGLRHAIKSSTSWWVTVRYAKRGRTRVVPLDDDALEAIVAWVKSRPVVDPLEQCLTLRPEISLEEFVNLDQRELTLDQRLALNLRPCWDLRWRGDLAAQPRLEALLDEHGAASDQHVGGEGVLGERRR
jgi:site-specific recombinase XerD